MKEGVDGRAVELEEKRQRKRERVSKKLLGNIALMLASTQHLIANTTAAT